MGKITRQDSDQRLNTDHKHIACEGGLRSTSASVGGLLNPVISDTKSINTSVWIFFHITMLTVILLLTYIFDTSALAHVLQVIFMETDLFSSQLPSLCLL